MFGAVIEAVVYFNSPRTQWSGKVQDEDVILRRSYRWRWLARYIARSTHFNLDPTRCGWCVVKDGEVIEHVEPIASIVFGRT